MDYPYDLGRYSRKVTTASGEAQRWFDRGLNWCFGYHHEEAVACFEKALAADPNCVMAHWGAGYAAGPNYNFPWELQDPAGKAAALARAYDSTYAALAMADHVSAPERALIEALPARYPQRDPIDDQRPWNDAFADAMRQVHQAHPDDLDLRAIFVEAILNRTPWRMWDLRTGEPAPGAGTIEAREVLESAFRDLPGAMDHPGLLHLYVHLMEMSPHPEVALVAGDRLRELTPDMGHLAHMPTHIDVQCGHYRDTLHWNQKAVIADRKFYDRAGPMNFYSGYRVHNYHFTAYGAMFLGQFTPAIAAADELIETMPEEALRISSPPMADFFESYVSIRQHVLIRFGKWHEIIAQDLPADRDLYCNTVAMMHYAKGVAHAALGDVPAAQAEQALFREAAKRVPKSRYLHKYPACSYWRSPRRCWRARSPTAAASTRRLSSISALPSHWRTPCPMTSLGAGCSRSATRSARCYWSRIAQQKPRRSIARISAWAAHCLALRSTRTICGPCSGSWSASSGAARPQRPR
jgi:tetratricopeptide (TPR) repeat protein